MENKHARINIDEIASIPSEEFKSIFQQWIEEDGVTKDLQAKLRRDLIFTFNKTRLGRKISSQPAKGAHILLSPIVLALNTIIAEFLYSQNCHFALSVLATEIPYRNTLPDFEKQPYFRFNRKNLDEIFDAVNINIPLEIRNRIAQLYLNKSKKDSISLLQAIFQVFFNMKNTGIIVGNLKPNPVRMHSKVCSQTSEKSQSHKSFKCQKLLILNKYLEQLLKKINKMSANLEKIERTGAKNIHGEKLLKLKRCNRSLNRISQNYKILTLNKRKKNRITTIVFKINKLAEQMEKCVLGFNQIAQSISVEQKKNLTTEKSYNDWLYELKTSRNGQKILNKIESALHKNLQAEKENLFKIFEQRLEDQTALVRLQYKQKLLEKLGKYSNRSYDETNIKISKLASEKIEDLESKQQDPILSSSEGHNNEATKEISRKKLLKKSEDSVGCKTILLESNETTQSDLNEKVNDIISNAKLRIKELEYESHELDNTLQKYLKVQHDLKDKAKKEATNILKDYNTKTSILTNKKERIEHFFQINNGITQEYEATNENTSDSKNIFQKQESLEINFKNPFEQLSHDILSKTPWKICNKEKIFKINLDFKNDQGEPKEKFIESLCYSKERKDSMKYNDSAKENNIQMNKSDVFSSKIPKNGTKVLLERSYNVSSSSTPSIPKICKELDSENISPQNEGVIKKNI